MPDFVPRLPVGKGDTETAALIVTFGVVPTTSLSTFSDNNVNVIRVSDMNALADYCCAHLSGSVAFVHRGVQWCTYLIVLQFEICASATALVAMLLLATLQGFSGS